MPDGGMHRGGVASGAAYLNLNEPGAVRALVDEALGRGYRGAGDRMVIDGWSLLDRAAARRERPGR